MNLPWVVCEVGFECDHPEQVFEDIAVLLPENWRVSGFYGSAIYFAIDGMLTLEDGERVKYAVANLDRLPTEAVG